MKLRNGLSKSRNGNYSLSENREASLSANNISAPIFSQNTIENMNRGSIGGMNPKTYESESSLFNDIKNNLVENSFNE
jgi:hypothetical protein